jgi:crotonobetainyl-CoA:carnitine CoA-transferase CaiB-like acyl-CoA transferase
MSLTALRAGWKPALQGAGDYETHAMSGSQSAFPDPTLNASLRGLRVLDFSRVFAGPACTQLLADLGAEVLKIERPDGGDDTRAWGPPFAGGESAYYLCLNRGKHSLVLDLGTDEGAESARRLAAKADVLVENFRVGWMAERRLDYPALSAANPGLVYCSVTGCGQTGPDADLPGYDFLTQGRAGLMSITGEAEGPPLKVGVAVSDLTTGLYAAAGILGALRQRDSTGRGQYLDLSLLDCQVAGLANVASGFLVSGDAPQRYGNAHPHIVPYELFAAADGPFILAAGNDAQWRRLCAVLGQPEWATDPRFATNAARVEHRETLCALLRERLARRPRAEWLALLQAAGVPAGPVQELDEVFTDPQVQVRGMVQEVEHPTAGRLRLVANPLLREATPAAPPPRLGEGGAALARCWLESGR